MDKISVIVPIYNSSKTLDCCLESIVNQTYSNLEIILVENGSTDNSLDLCREWAEKDKRIKVLQSGKGVSKARNYGLDNISGDYFAFVDSDDYIENTMYEELLNKAINNSHDLVLCKFYGVKNSVIEPINEKFWTNTNQKFDCKLYFDNSLKPAIWRCLYKKELSQNIRFDESLYLGEDLIYMLNILDEAKSIGLVDKYLYFYTIDLTQKKYYSDKYIDNRIKICKQYCNILINHGYEDLAKKTTFSIFKGVLTTLARYDKDYLKNVAFIKKSIFDRFSFKDCKKAYVKNKPKKSLLDLLVVNQNYRTIKFLSKVKEKINMLS